MRGERQSTRSAGVNGRRLVLLFALTLIAVLVAASAADARTIRGTAKSDTLRGTAKADRIFGLAGSDRIIARGGGSDRVFCGAGRDRVTADASDKVARNCESVSRTGATARPKPPSDDAGGDTGHQHGELGDHLLGPGEWGQLDFVSKLDFIATEGRPENPDLVADVAVSPDNNWAYLANWGEVDCIVNSEAGGINSPDAGAWIVDIRDPANPKTTGFIASSQDTRPGEGMQVVHVDTAHFSGEILAMNNEHCGFQGKGGLSLWDVTNPLKPFKLSEHFGDRTPPDAQDTHSTFVWDAGDKAYAVMTDNAEAIDVDIMDITNPKRPRLIAEFDLNDEFHVDQPSHGPIETFLHDMVVKNINGTWTMLLSYWDGGYVQLDVDDPTRPTLIGETEFAAVDPVLKAATGKELRPEGNAHQAEFSLDNQFFVGTDEDFGPYTVGEFQITTGPNAGTYPSVVVPGAAPVTILPDKSLNGPTAYVGYACPGGVAPPPASSIAWPTLAAGEEKIAVVQRGPAGDPADTVGACFPGEKADIVKAAGYDAIVFVQRHLGSAALDANTPFCGSGAFTQPIVGVCTSHEAFHKLFNTTPSYELPYPVPHAPALGAVGERVLVDSEFDGWGYIHLFDNTPGSGGLSIEAAGVTRNPLFKDLDQYAIPEAHMEGHALESGTLSVHEVAADTTNPRRFYSSYYSGGMVMFEIRCTNPADKSTCTLDEVGGYLDAMGNDFWGVETYRKNNTTYVLGSDRASGLWVFKVCETCAPAARAPIAPPAPE
jgi:hemolysin type calcium-binding protein